LVPDALRNIWNNGRVMPVTQTHDTPPPVQEKTTPNVVNTKKVTDNKQVTKTVIPKNLQKTAQQHTDEILSRYRQPEPIDNLWLKPSWQEIEARRSNVKPLKKVESIGKSDSSIKNKPGKFDVKDAERALRLIHDKYGKEMAENIERMYRDETAHFTSKQYIHTGTGGMEEGKWDMSLFNEYPEYAPVGTWSAFENKGASGLGGNEQVTDRRKVFLVLPSVEAAMVYKAEYIKRHGGNFARWHSTNKAKQDFYRSALLKIRTPIVNSFK
jgi:hypothetical protein